VLERRAQDERLWQHGLHEDSMLFRRGNLFLLALSLQVVAHATGLSASTQAGVSAHPNVLPTRVIAAFGVALTLSGLYVGHRHFQCDEGVQRRIRLPKYRETHFQPQVPYL